MSEERRGWVVLVGAIRGTGEKYNECVIGWEKCPGKILYLKGVARCRAIVSLVGRCCGDEGGVWWIRGQAGRAGNGGGQWRSGEQRKRREASVRRESDEMSHFKRSDHEKKDRCIITQIVTFQAI